MEKKIAVRCKGADYVDFKLLNPFQGNLKSLSTENYEKLKKVILEHGFTSPVNAWKAKNGELYVLDGHQRCRALKTMEQEGYAIPKVPVVYVDAKNKKEAKLIVLSHASQYGKVEGEGLYEFVHEAEIDAAELADSFNFPEIDFEDFQENFFEEPKVTEANEKKRKECPKCGHQY